MGASAQKLLLFTLLLLVSLVAPASAQSGPPPQARPVSSGVAPFSAFEGKWVKYSSTPPTFIEVSTIVGKPHVQYVGPKTGKHYDCTNVTYLNGELSFEFPGKPVPIYKLRLAPGGTQLTGEFVLPSVPYPVPVVMERVDAWPTPEEIAARGPAGPTTVRGVIP